LALHPLRWRWLVVGQAVIAAMDRYDGSAGMSAIDLPGASPDSCRTRVSMMQMKYVFQLRSGKSGLGDPYGRMRL
jgi:hypothetical protein